MALKPLNFFILYFQNIQKKLIFNFNVFNLFNAFSVFQW